MANPRLLEELETRFSELTKTQKLAADYIIKNPMAAVFSTVDQLAQAAGTSTATVVRLALFLGYSGYAEFQRDLQEQVQRRMAPSRRLEERFQHLSAPDNVLSEIFFEQLAALQETFEALDEAKLTQAVDRITHSRRSYVTGSRSCFSVAHYLGYNLTRILGNCRFLNPSDVSFGEELSLVGPGDTLLCLSLPRYITSVVTAARVAKERGAYVIAITDGYRSPLAACCDLLFRVGYKSYDFHNSVMPAMLIAEILISLVTAQAPHSVKDNLARAEKILAELNVHVEL